MIEWAGVLLFGMGVGLALAGFTMPLQAKPLAYLLASTACLVVSGALLF